MIERPLLLPLVALMAGISATILFGTHFPLVLVAPILLLLVIGMLRNSPLLLVCGVAVASLLWGNYSARTAIKPTIPDAFFSSGRSDPLLNIVGTLYQRPQTKKNSTALFLQLESVEGTPVSGRALISVKSGSIPVITGDRIRLATRLTHPRNFGIPGEYDYQRSLAVRGISAVGFLADAEDIVTLQSGAAYAVQRRFDRIALWLCRFIDTAVAAPESGVLQALLVGERGAVAPEIEALYARTGVNHILSISGFHVGILAIVLYQVLWHMVKLAGWPLLFNIRWKMLLATLPLLVFYLLVSGAAPATIRSVLMIGACSIALLLERETDSVNVLALAAFAILVSAPGALFNLSFQLSFLALWGILVLTPIFMGWYRWRKAGTLYRTVQFIAVSAAAILATLLPVAYSFHRVSVAGVLSNFIAVPLLGYGAVVIGFAALACAPLLPVPAALLLKLTGLLVTLSNGAMTLIDRLPQLPSFSPSLLQVALSIVLLAIFTVVRRNGIRLAAACAVILLGVLSAFAGEDGRPALQVTFFSVGQGESTLVRFQDGSNMLVDGGGALHEGGFDVGERLLVPALRTLGIRRIDRLVMTHPHPDHLRGLITVAGSFPVGEFWESGYRYHSPDYLLLKGMLAAQGVPVRWMHAGVAPVTVGGAAVQPLAPPPPGPDVPAMVDANEESMVFRLSYGDFSMLFTGDSGFATEALLLSNGAPLRSTVLKVAHHGSRHSSSVPFLHAVAPRLALISAGYGNSFGLPAAATVNDLQQAGAVIHRTDRDGSLQLTVAAADGRYTVKKYPPAPIDSH